MPERRLSKLKAMREVEEVCLQHAQAIYDSTIGKALEERGYELKRMLNGLFNESESDEIRQALLEGNFEDVKNHYSGWMVEGTQAIADFIVWHEEKHGCAALIEATACAVIQVFGQDVMAEMERFAEAWEKERPALKQRIDADFGKHLNACGFTSGQFSETVTIIEA